MRRILECADAAHAHIDRGNSNDANEDDVQCPASRGWQLGGTRSWRRRGRRPRRCRRRRSRRANSPSAWARVKRGLPGCWPRPERRWCRSRYEGSPGPPHRLRGKRGVDKAEPESAQRAGGKAQREPQQPQGYRPVCGVLRAVEPETARVSNFARLQEPAMPATSAPAPACPNGNGRSRSCPVRRRAGRARILTKRRGRRLEDATARALRPRGCRWEARLLRRSA